MNNNFLLLLSLVTLFLVLLISGFSFILVNRKITMEEEEPKAWCGTFDPTYDSDAYATGKALFKANCATCHNKNMKADMTGPALGGVLERWNGDTTRLYDFIRNAQLYIDTANDPYAITIGEWDPSVMQSFPDLTNENIDAILEYIEGSNTYYRY